ncbi:melanoma-associated antigen 10-like [Cervus canadensis]|uniref:melanoma-associated antigen 10-like n=1 Tax=Cervus canadensis TaxID=1574408 RepID=UPI001CA34075|nr:melanoma-associated antigen 10-like [Cervus canadensis]
MSPTCVVSLPHIRISDWGPGMGAGFLTSESQTGWGEPRIPGPARRRGEVPEGGLRGPCVRTDGTPQIPAPVVGPGRALGAPGTRRGRQRTEAPVLRSEGRGGPGSPRSQVSSQGADLPAEILKKVLRDNQEHFPVVFSQASQCLELVCGVEVKEVDPREHIYIMVPNLGLTCDVMLSGGQSMPKAGLLVLILSLIMRNGDRAPEEKVWGALSRLGVCVGSVHCVFGEPRTLLTHVWAQQGYLEYRQVPYSYPARYEFLWGPRAYAETSKREVMAFLLRVKERASRAFPPLPVEAAREEDEAA